MPPPSPEAYISPHSAQLVGGAHRLGRSWRRRRVDALRGVGLSADPGQAREELGGGLHLVLRRRAMA